MKKSLFLSFSLILITVITNAQQTIALVEQFNGHRCVNCPAANDRLDSLKNHYQDSMVYVNLHAYTFAEPLVGTFNADYTNSVSEDYYDTFNPIGVPMSLSNRMDTSGMFATSPVGQYIQDSVGVAVAEIVQIPSPVDMVLSASYNAGTNELNVDLNTQLQTNLNGDYNVVYYFVEDNLVSPQEAPGGVINNYVHRNVLRDAMNGTWGSMYCSGLTTIGSQISTSIQYQPDPSWNLSNSRIIAYIRSVADERIIQVAHLELSTVVGVEEESFNTLEVYPNPANELLFIHLPESVTALTINIYNSIGQEVVQSSIYSNEALDISNLSVGTYLIRARSAKGGVYSNTLIVR